MLHKCVEHVIFIAMKKVYHLLSILSLIAIFNFTYGYNINFSNLDLDKESFVETHEKVKDDLDYVSSQAQNKIEQNEISDSDETESEAEKNRNNKKTNTGDEQKGFVYEASSFNEKEDEYKEKSSSAEDELKNQTKIIRETARAFRLTTIKKEELEKEIQETLHIQISDFIGETSITPTGDKFEKDNFEEEFNKLQKKDEFKFSATEEEVTEHEKYTKDINDELSEKFMLHDRKEAFADKNFDKKIEQSYEKKEIEEHIQDLTKEAQRDADLILKSTVKKEIPPNSVGIAVGSSLEDLVREIERKTGLKIETGERSRQVVKRINKKAEDMTKYMDLLPPKQWESLFKDSDSDGVSDYDEIYVYKTDPNNPYTAGGELTDGEKIALGLNVHSPEPEPAPVESPKYAGEVVPEVFEVTKIEKQPDKLKIEGSALPNSFVTLFVYSTPIVVTVKADDRGHWSYELKTELEDGKHELYVATVNYAGKIVAKSPAVPFTLTAEAAYFEPLTVNIAETSIIDIFKKYMFITSFLVALIFVLFILLFLGFKLSRKHTVSPNTL